VRGDIGISKGGAERTFVLLGERDDALHLRCALEYGDSLLGGVSDDERPGGGGGAPGAGDEAERVERAGRGGRSGEGGGGWRGGGQEESLRGHGRQEGWWCWLLARWKDRRTAGWLAADKVGPALVKQNTLFLFYRSLHNIESYKILE
jgi:hypothetical protein